VVGPEESGGSVSEARHAVSTPAGRDAGSSIRRNVNSTEHLRDAGATAVAAPIPGLCRRTRSAPGHHAKAEPGLQGVGGMVDAGDLVSCVSQGLPAS
jgi:hypothetical protein